MNHQERVLTAIGHREPDRVPKGELMVEGRLVEALLGEEQARSLAPFPRELAVRELLGMDLVHVHEFPMEQVGQSNRGNPIYRSVLGDEHEMTEGSSRLIRPALADIADAASYPVPDVATATTRKLDWFRDHSDLFLMCQIGGPVSSLDWMLGTEDYLVYCAGDPAAVRCLAEKVMEFEIARARLFLDHGAQAILIADDIAYNRGLFLPPRLMEQLAYPFYRDAIREIKAHRDVPVLLHSDGDLRAALPHIVECGFDGVQSLQPSAGMDIEEVKRRYGDALCLMGNLDLDRLMPFGTPEEVAAEVRRLCETIGPGGGFILSTCNILIDAVPPENALAMYRAAEQYGVY